MIEVVLLLAVGVFVGWHHRNVSDKIDELFDKFDDQHPAAPAVTSANPMFTNQNQSGHTESLIIEPKSPMLVDWEEQQELERMNKTVKMKPR